MVDVVKFGAAVRAPTAPIAVGREAVAAGHSRTSPKENAKKLGIFNDERLRQARVVLAHSRGLTR